jgi:hypothetical protein
MTSRFSAVETRFHRGTSGSHARDCLEPAKLSGLPPIPLGSIAILAGYLRYPLGLPAIPSASCDGASRPFAVLSRGYLVEFRCRARDPVGIAEPCISPRLVRESQRVSFCVNATPAQARAMQGLRRATSPRRDNRASARLVMKPRVQRALHERPNWIEHDLPIGRDDVPRAPTPTPPSSAGRCSGRSGRSQTTSTPSALRLCQAP